MRGRDLSECIVTAHARDVQKRRGIPWDAVAKALREPHVIEPHQGRWRVVRGPLAVVVADLAKESPVVVTLLLRGVEETWNDDMARAIFNRMT